MSIKMFQSEIGVTGEPSPNVALLDPLSDLLDKFEHDHNNITVNDCFIFLTGIKMGEPIVYDPEHSNQGMAVYTMFKGCTEDLICSLVGIMVKDPLFLTIFQAAIKLAMDELEKQNPRYDNLN